MSKLISTLMSTEEGRLLYDFLLERFPRGMNSLDVTTVFFNCDNLEWFKKEQDEFFSSFEIWKKKRNLK